MTPEEKWKRLTNPQGIEDYGLSMNETELRQVSEARLQVLLPIRRGQRAARNMERIVSPFVKALSITMYNLCREVLQ
jgi:hypothetical protein